MEMTSRREFSTLSSPFSSPNVAALLKIKILSWSQETGFPLCIRVRIADRTFNLHKHPLTSKSGYFSEKLKESNEVDLPSYFPGGAETFEIIALFIYGSSTLVNPFNVASFRCAAEFLHMTEEYGTGNLCERFDIYLNQVVLQSWDDTLIVLRKCQTLLPLAEELLIVSRCIETLAFMACMEILDPERRRDKPVHVTLEALSSCKAWTDHHQDIIDNIDLWIRDLIALPLAFFKRVVGSLRRQGMKEKYVCPIILFYAHKWLRSKEEENDEDYKNMLQGIIDMVPMGMRSVSNKVIPVAFYFCLLWTCVERGFRNESVEKLINHTASILHWAQVEDFLLPRDDATTELSIMETIFSTYYLSYSDHTPLGNHCVVAELWDIYLNQIARDSELGCTRFMNLIETVPISSRQTHDHLYTALNTFFLSHPDLLQEEKGLVCKYLNCQKLSPEVCVEAVQNELMPLRLIVQAIFMQQLNTQLAFKDSFRYTNCGEFSGSISSSRYANSKSQNLGDSPYIISEGCSRPLSSLLQKDLSTRKPVTEFRSEISRNDYESTSFRIQNLEKELISLKRTLESQQISNKNERSCNKIEPVSEPYYGLVERRMSKKKNSIGFGQVKSCIGTVNFASQRKYVNGLLKVLRRISLFGLGRSKRKQHSSASNMRSV